MNLLPLPNIGKFLVVKSPVSAPMYVKIWNESPGTGVKLLTRVTFSVPARDTLPVTRERVVLSCGGPAQLDVQGTGGGLGVVARDRGKGGVVAAAEIERAGVGHVGRQGHAVIQFQDTRTLDLDRRDTAKLAFTSNVPPFTLSDCTLETVRFEVCTVPAATTSAFVPVPPVIVVVPLQPLRV